MALLNKYTNLKIIKYGLAENKNITCPIFMIWKKILNFKTKNSCNKFLAKKVKSQTFTHLYLSQ